MQFTSTFFSLAVFIGAALGAPSSRAPLRELKKVEGEKSGRLIVSLKDGISRSDVLGDIGVVSAYADDWEILNAFVVDHNEETLEALLAHPDVAEVEEDGIVYATTTQTNAPWGLSRLSASAKLSSTDTSALTYSYTYDATAGAGVNVYVIDTGIRTTHSQFGGRASWGATYGGYANSDGNGHGTHVAGTIAGSQYGVAKAANVFAVKVLSDSGSGTNSDVISGLNYALTQYRSTGVPTVASLSLGGSASTTVDNAVASLTSGGVHVVVAAGNSNTDAGSTSPARAPSAITVGASTIADARASFSNYGSVVDIFAPGQNVISSWSTSDTATNNISGTSMATPHISGLVAYLIGLNGNATPASIQSTIQSLSQKNLLTGIPSGTVNYLAHNA